MDGPEASVSLVCPACKRKARKETRMGAPWYAVRNWIDDRLDRPQLAPDAWGGMAEMPLPGDEDDEALYHRFGVRLARR
jgi:hypothetical protein